MNKEKIVEIKIVRATESVTVDGINLKSLTKVAEGMRRILPENEIITTIFTKGKKGTTFDVPTKKGLRKAAVKMAKLNPPRNSEESIFGILVQPKPRKT
jgi:hypothetical protein